MANVLVTRLPKLISDRLKEEGINKIDSKTYQFITKILHKASIEDILRIVHDSIPETRQELKKLGSKKRHRFMGIVERFGIAHEGTNKISTIMLRDLRLYGKKKVLTDHVWIKVRKQLDDLELKVGDMISFDARIDTYTKNYKDGVTDYRLTYPSKIEIL